MWTTEVQSLGPMGPQDCTQFSETVLISKSKNVRQPSLPNTLPTPYTLPVTSYHIHTLSSLLLFLVISFFILFLIFCHSEIIVLVLVRNFMTIENMTVMFLFEMTPSVTLLIFLLILTKTKVTLTQVFVFLSQMNSLSL